MRVRREDRRTAYWSRVTNEARAKGQTALTYLALSRLQSAVAKLPPDRRDAALAEAEQALHQIRFRHTS
jgi:hypothetical protein